MYAIKENINTSKTSEQIKIAATLKKAYNQRVAYTKTLGVKVTQQLMAQKLGLSQSLISQYFSGDVPIPLDNLRLLSDYLGVDTSRFSSKHNELKKGGKGKLFVLNSGRNLGEWKKSTAYYEEGLVNRGSFVAKFTDDIVLENGEVLYRHGGSFQAFLHLCPVEFMTNEQIQSAKAIVLWGGGDQDKEMAGYSIFLKKETWLEKQKSLISDKYGLVPMIVMDIILK